MGLGCQEVEIRGRDGACVGQKGVEIWGWKRFGRDERIHGLAYCSIIGGVEKQCISLTRVAYTNRWEALVVLCGDSELSYNERGCGLWG